MSVDREHPERGDPELYTVDAASRLRADLAEQEAQHLLMAVHAMRGHASVAAKEMEQHSTETRPLQLAPDFVYRIIAVADAVIRATALLRAQRLAIREQLLRHEPASSLVVDKPET